MKKKFLTTTLLSISLLSLNLFATGQTKCAAGFCMVDLSSISPKLKKQKSQKNIVNKNSYKIVVLDNIETMIFHHTKYIMTENEVAEYDLNQMQKNLLVSTLNSDNLPISEELCEDDLKAVEVVGIANTYECT